MNCDDERMDFNGNNNKLIYSTYTHTEGGERELFIASSAFLVVMNI